MGAHDFGDRTVFTKADNESPEAPEINWRHNCLTPWIHDGRPEVIWNLPLRHAAMMFGLDNLQGIVVARIRNDAQMFVDHGTETSADWPDKVAEKAEFYFLETFGRKLTEIDDYYSSPAWKRSLKDLVPWVQQGKLNPHYQPLHSHDSINLLCRILGQKANYKVRETDEA